MTLLNKFWQFLEDKNPKTILLRKELILLSNELYDVNKTIVSLTKKYNKLNENTILECYCDSHFKSIVPIAYQQKRNIEGLDYSVSLNELITRDSYEVGKLMRYIDRSANNVLKVILNISRKITKELTWDSDNNLAQSGDYYLYPAETIIRKKGDCEDISLVTSSCHSEIGCAWGFLKGNGHCFNVFVSDGELYVLENSGSIPLIKKYDEQTDYVIHYIVTKNNCYQIKSGTHFGRIAGW